MNGKPISNSEDQEAARPLRIVVKFGSGFHFIAYPNSPCILSLQIFNTFPFSDYLFTEMVKNLMDLSTALWNKKQAISRAKERLAMLHRVDSPGDLDLGTSV
jgi:hypothetical protein